ncbi:MAG: hypothetical protein ACOC3T_01790 [Bacteroidota bacterium]
MKRKIFISLATFLFASITFYNVQVSQNNGDISLEHIALMAEASDESGGGEIVKCMVSGGGLWASAYRCDDPGYPTLPQYKCGTPFWPRTGRKLVQCFK